MLWWEVRASHGSISSETLLQMTRVPPSNFNSAFKRADAENLFLKQVLLSGIWEDFKSLVPLTLHFTYIFTIAYWYGWLNSSCCSSSGKKLQHLSAPGLSPLDEGVVSTPISACSAGVWAKPPPTPTAMGGRGQEHSSGSLPPSWKRGSAGFWLGASPWIASSQQWDCFRLACSFQSISRQSCFNLRSTPFFPKRVFLYNIQEFRCCGVFFLSPRKSITMKQT